MKRALAIIGTAILLFGASACGEKKPPEPGAYQGKMILSVVRDLAQAYEKRDLDGFMDLIAKGYEGRETFGASIGQVFSKYDSVRFSFHETKMLVMVLDRGNIKASVNWDGEWRTAKGGFLKDGGRVTLVFDPGVFQVLSIEGKNPFLPVEKQGK